MSRIALDGIRLAVGEWPGLREADTRKHAIEVLAAGVSRGRVSRERRRRWPPMGFAVC